MSSPFSRSLSLSTSCVLCPGGAAPVNPLALTQFSNGISYTCSEIEDLIYSLSHEVLDDNSTKNVILGHMGLDTDALERELCVPLQMKAQETCCEESWNSVCDPFNDPCPMTLDGKCRVLDPRRDPDDLCYSVMADCLDCDPCSAFHYTSCEECTSSPAGCFWCPGDALCHAKKWPAYPLDPNDVIHGPGGGCPSEEDWLTSETCDSSSSDDRVFSDPLYDSDAWAYGIFNVESVWKQGITGQGIHIRFNDEGVDANHPEFSGGKFDVNASCDVYLPSNVTEHHGTACASIATAQGNNGECAVGIAPDARLSSCKIFGPGAVTHGKDDFYSFLTHALEFQDISSNSWGSTPCSFHLHDKTRRRNLKTDDQKGCPFLSDREASPCSVCDFTAPSPLDGNCTDAILHYCENWYNYEADHLACIQHLDLFTACHFNGIEEDLQANLATGVKLGRNGKGLIFVFAASNENLEGSYTSFDGQQSSRFGINVGALGKDAKHSSYSTVGPSVLVSAPGGDIDTRSNWITAKPFGGCRDATIGTSFAAPAVAGMIALILQVNPDLGWRDVQGILVTTSRMWKDVDVKDDEEDELSSWTTNGAGLHHSYKYGFGIADAPAAVSAAQTWENYSAERMLTAKSGTVNIPIDDLGTVVTSTVKVEANMIVESVVVYLDISSSSLGHLEIRLVSPQGTESILAPGMRPANSLFAERWRLRTVRSWGESSEGKWTLSVVDTKPGDVSECVDVPFDDDAPCSAYKKCKTGIAELDAALAQLCCKCGGGVNATDVPNVLVSWTLILYGRELEGEGDSTFPPASDTVSLDVLSPKDLIGSAKETKGAAADADAEDSDEDKAHRLLVEEEDNDSSARAATPFPYSFACIAWVVFLGMVLPTMVQ